MSLSPPSRDNITGWVLAGGQGSRMGGVDKGLQLFQGQALAQRAVERLRPQVRSVCINANRHLDEYRAWGFEVYEDAQSGYAGPLMGFLTGLVNCDTEWLMVVPCDCPYFPMDLVARLSSVVLEQQALLASVHAPEENLHGELHMRPQPVFCLLHRSLLDSLQRFLDTGGRKIDAWTALHRMPWLQFNPSSDESHAFANANTWQELQALQKPPG
jgi:molybdopterin-guanine dinucleotide biosynthesis protein A